jgi:predicted nucleotidyltransferase
MSAQTPQDLTPGPFPEGNGQKEAVLEQERQRYVDALARVVEALPGAFAQIPEVERVWLFGSYVRGRRDLCTDLDLLVIMRSEHDMLTRTARLYERVAAVVALDVDLDLVVYTPEEFAQMRGRGFVQHVLSEGRVIYERAT